MVDITKHFGTITANKNVSLDIRKGEILSLLGENGSGKTTLMNMLSGIYYPDGGRVSGIVDARKTQKNEVGLLMTNLGSADSSAE